MLTGIMELLADRGRLSLSEIAQHFRMETTALEPIMETLVRKGRVALVQAGCASGTCSGCFCASRESMLMYEPVTQSGESVPK